jgi:Ribbon-helix-helix protein, copG family
MSKERITLYITEQQKKRLDKRSQEEILPVAEIIRRAIDAYLAWDDPTYNPSAQGSEKGRSIHPPHE